MIKSFRIPHYAFCILHSAFCILLASCTSEDYRTGDGDYSYYSAEMAILSLKDSLVGKAELDDSRTLQFASPLQSSVLRKNYKQSVVGDSCRLMLYYNKGEETAAAIKATQMHGASQVLMPRIALADTLKAPVKKDPLNVISSWKSKNGKYYNLNISVKTGIDEGEARAQSLGFVCDSVTTIQPQNLTTVHLSLTHDQKGLPQYYSVEAFLSIRLSQLLDLLKHYGISTWTNPSISLTVNTYQGKKTIAL